MTGQPLLEISGPPLLEISGPPHPEMSGPVQPEMSSPPHPDLTGPPHPETDMAGPPDPQENTMTWTTKTTDFGEFEFVEGPGTMLPDGLLDEISNQIKQLSQRKLSTLFNMYIKSLIG